MADITLSSAVRSNLLSLQNTASLLGQTQERLATGLRVNSALDDPTSFFTASSLNSRAGDLNRLLDSVGNAIQTLEAADNGISAITDLVETAQATARQALQSATGSTASVQSTSASVAADSAATVTGIDAGIVSSTPASVTGTTAIVNDNAAEVASTIDLSGDTGATVSTTTLANDTAATATGSAIGANTQALSALGIADGDSIIFDDGNGNTTTISFGTAATSGSSINIADTATAAVTAINAALTADDNAIRLVEAGTPASALQLTINGDGTAFTNATISDSGGGELTALGLAAIGTSSGANSRTIAATNTALAGNTTGTFNINGNAVNLSSITNADQLASTINGFTDITATNTNGVVTITNEASPAGDLTIDSDTNSGIAAAGLTAVAGTTSASNTTIAAIGATGFQIGVGGANPADVDLSGVSDVAGLVQAINDQTTGITAVDDGDGTFTVTADDPNDSVQFVGGATLGVEDQTAEGSSSVLTAINTSTVFSINTGDGFDVGETIDLNNFTSASALNDALGQIDGVTAELNSEGYLSITAPAGEDFSISGGATFGVADEPYSPVSAAFQSLADNGAELVITIGDSTNTITFGADSANNQVDTLSELETQLGNISGGTASLNSDGTISITAASTTDTIEIDGTYNADSTLGLTAGTTEPSNATFDALAAGSTLTIQFGDADTQTITFGADGDAGEVNTLAELTTALGAISGGTASIDSSGNLRIDADDASDSITIGGTAASSLGATTGTTAAGNSTTRAALEAQFTELRTQIDQLARDASFNGNNLINGDNLTVIFNEDNTSSLGIDGVTFDSAGLGISAVATDDFQSDANLNAALDELDGAIATLRTQSSTFGSNLSVVQIRQDFTNELINTLETGAANLTLADTNLEGANLLALQTRQQLSSTALSLASQADQNVLRLF